MDTLPLKQVSRARGVVDLPGSKSISNRILLLAALARGNTKIRGLLASDDTQRMLEALTTLGVAHGALEDGAHQVLGCGGDFPVKQAELFLGNAGTAFRPLTAALACSGGDYYLYGIARMHERPIGDLVDALRALGARVDYRGEAGFPPLQISPAKLAAADILEVSVRGDVSSQFLTALLLAAPLLKKSLKINVLGELISKPYIEITLRLMARFGVHVAREGWASFTVPAQQYVSPGEIFVEGDASSASYFLAAGLLGGGAVEVRGVGKNSIQGDVAFAAALEKMGATIEMGDDFIRASRAPDQPILALDMDCNAIPDAAMTLAICALFAEKTTTLRNIASWRVKETDRIAAMATELRKLGASVVEGEDCLQISPPQTWQAGAEIATYDDHRMAMCFSLASFGTDLTILDPNCVSKTFPNYFAEFARLIS